MSPLSPGTKENVQLNMKEFGQPSVKQDYTNSLECRIVNLFLPGGAVGFPAHPKLIRPSVSPSVCHIRFSYSAETAQAQQIQ
jgi:hypothetical protein